MQPFITMPAAKSNRIIMQPILQGLAISPFNPQKSRSFARAQRLNKQG
jgi:hypothetical protein